LVTAFILVAKSLKEIKLNVNLDTEDAKVVGLIYFAETYAEYVSLQKKYMKVTNCTHALVALGVMQASKFDQVKTRTEMLKDRLESIKEGLLGVFGINLERERDVDDFELIFDRLTAAIDILYLIKE